MAKIIIEGSSVAEVVALALSMQGGGNIAAAQVGTLSVGSSNISDDDDNGPVNTAAPQFDANGLPWDERIHASSKALTDKGAWRAKRGVAKELVAQVEAELRARGGMTANAQIIDPMQTTQVQMPQNPANMGGQMGQQPMGGMTQTPQTMPMGGQMGGGMGQQQVVQPTVPQDGPALMQWVGQNLAAGKINQDELAWLSGQLGLTSITDIISNPDKVAPAVALLQQHGKMTQ